MEAAYFGDLLSYKCLVYELPFNTSWDWRLEKRSGYENYLVDVLPTAR